MDFRGYRWFAGVVTATLAAGSFAATALAAPSLPSPGEQIKRMEPQGTAKVESMALRAPQGGAEVSFTVRTIDLDAPELKLNQDAVANILAPCLNREITLAALNDTVNQLTQYCRLHGYPAAAAYLPTQDSTEGVVKICIIPGRYDKVRIENRSRLQEDVVRGFLNGLKKGDIIRRSSLETALYGISDLSGTKAVGVLSPGSEFGTSDLTVRVEEGKFSSTVLYAENYGNDSSGRYRYGLQKTFFDVNGRGDKSSLGVMFSNHDMHNYYANYEVMVGRGGTTLGLGLSRMDYELGALGTALGANGVAYTASLFGSVPVYHLSERELRVRYGFNYRFMQDDFNAFPMMNREKDSQALYVGVSGAEKHPGLTLNYEATVTGGSLNLKSKTPLGQIFDANSGTEGGFLKAEGNVTAVQTLGHETDVMVKLQGQLANRNLDSSEQMYLGGANGVRAYPQGEGSGDRGFLGSLELRYHTPLEGMVLSAYFDAGYISEGALGRDMSLKGWGLGVSYSQPDDWFARFDYARRIGLASGASASARSRAQMWFMLGKIW